MTLTMEKKCPLCTRSSTRTKGDSVSTNSTRVLMDTPDLPPTFLLDGFQDYVIETEDTPSPFVAAVSIYVGLSLCLIVSFVLCRRDYDKLITEPAADENGPSERCAEEHSERIEMSEIRPRNRQDFQKEDATDPVPPERKQPNPPVISATNIKLSKNENGQKTSISPGKDAAYLLQAPETDSAQKLQAFNVPQHDEQETIRASRLDDYPIQGVERLSGVPSAATTSRLNTSSLQSGSKFRLGTWDLGSMRWKNYTPVKRVDAMQRYIRAERHAIASEEGSAMSRSRASWATQSGSRQPSNRNVSDLASRVLEEQAVDGEADFYRKQYRQRSRATLRSNGSYSASETSRMPALTPDVLGPEDAADAHDPGRSLNLRSHENVAASCIGRVLDLAEPDFETKRILELAIPATISAVSEPVFRIVLVAIISHFIDTDSMVAFILSTFFIRLTTEELSGAIVDAEATLLQRSLAQGGDAGFADAGKCIQLSLFAQIVLGMPLLFVWIFCIEDAVSWLISSPRIANLASSYTQVIIIDYILQSLSKSFMLTFHLTAQARFETSVDLCSALSSLTAIVLAVTFSNAPSLVLIGWIQVIAGITKIVIKFAYIALKGWMQPYAKGLLGPLLLFDTGSVLSFLRVFFPLLLGSLIELREWSMLTFFVSHLGEAEVATWSLMGILWEILEASTDGVGESATKRVAFHLAEEAPSRAKQLARKAVLLVMVETICVMSIFLMAGPNISVAFTKDATLQHLMNLLVGMTGLAYIAMSLAQVFWSLAGSQGRFGLASLVILACRWFITMPLAAICSFGLSYDLKAMAMSIAVGYMTAAIILMYLVFSIDWKDLSIVAQEQTSPTHEDSIHDSSVDEAASSINTETIQ